MKIQTYRKISMLLLLNIQDFLEKTVRGEVTLPKQLVEEFKTACGEAVDKQFSKPRDKERLRMSGLGRPVCQQQLAMRGEPKQSSYNDVMRFLFGDLVEAVAMLVMKASGIKVVAEQKPCEIVLDGETIKGTLDVILDEEGEHKVWDIKSASPYSFDYKFKKGYDVIKEDDAFGYIMQGHLYGEANKLPFGGWIVINKSSGEWAVVPAPDDQMEERKQLIIEANNIVKQIKSNKFKIPFKPEWETYKDKGEIIRTKNKLMPKLCTFCEYKAHCWSKATYQPKITSRAKSPPNVWYTTYAQKSL